MPSPRHITVRALVACRRRIPLTAARPSRIPGRDKISILSRGSFGAAWALRRSGARVSRLLRARPNSPLAPQALFAPASRHSWPAAPTRPGRCCASSARNIPTTSSIPMCSITWPTRLADNDAAAAAELFKQSLDRFPGEPPSEECRYGLARASELAGRQTMRKGYTASYARAPTLRWPSNRF